MSEMVELRPVRVQRKRTKGWTMPPNTVSVTRPGIWGNPFLVHPNHQPGRKWGATNYLSVPTIEDAVECYREMLGSPGETADALRSLLPTLRGKNLACFCRIDQPCHADVLLELANPPPSTVSPSEPERNLKLRDDDGREDSPSHRPGSVDG